MSSVAGNPLRGQYVCVNVDHIVHVGPFINKCEDYAMTFGPIRENLCTVRTSDGSWLYVDLPPEVVAAMLVDEDVCLTSARLTEILVEKSAEEDE